MNTRFYPSEKQVQQTIENYLGFSGYVVERMNSGRMRYTNAKGGEGMVRLHTVGTPDLMAHKKLLDGTTHLLYVEVKAHGNKPTPLQLHRMEELIDHGAECVVAWSVDDVTPHIKK